MLSTRHSAPLSPALPYAGVSDVASPMPQRLTSYPPPMPPLRTSTRGEPPHILTSLHEQASAAKRDTETAEYGADRRRPADWDALPSNRALDAVTDMIRDVPRSYSAANSTLRTTSATASEDPGSVQLKLSQYLAAAERDARRRQITPRCAAPSGVHPGDAGIILTNPACVAGLQSCRFRCRLWSLD